MVFKREVEGDIKALKDAKIVAFSCPLDSMATETKVRWVIRLKNVYNCAEIQGTGSNSQASKHDHIMKWTSIWCFQPFYHFLNNKGL